MPTVSFPAVSSPPITVFTVFAVSTMVVPAGRETAILSEVMRVIPLRVSVLIVPFHAQPSSVLMIVPVSSDKSNYTMRTVLPPTVHLA